MSAEDGQRDTSQKREKTPNRRQVPCNPSGDVYHNKGSAYGDQNAQESIVIFVGSHFQREAFPKIDAHTPCEQHDRFGWQRKRLVCKEVFGTDIIADIEEKTQFNPAQKLKGSQNHFPSP